MQAKASALRSVALAQSSLARQFAHLSALCAVRLEPGQLARGHDGQLAISRLDVAVAKLRKREPKEGERGDRGIFDTEESPIGSLTPASARP